MRKIRTYHEVPGDAGKPLLDQVLAQRERLAARLASIHHVVAVGSGKGGVGKSAVTANLAAALAARGRRVGAADADLNGPSLARMLGARAASLRVDGQGVHPASGECGVRVISMDLLLGAEDAPVRWREPEEGRFIWQSTLETGALREFLADVVWGELDALLIDVAPGTDKLERLLQLVPRPAALILVTTPAETARHVVARSVRLVCEAGVPRVGLVANMTSHVCVTCGHEQPLFAGDGAVRLARDAGVPLWAEIPFDGRLAESTDAGTPFVLSAPDAPAARALAGLADRLEAELDAPEAATEPGGPTPTEPRAAEPGGEAEDADRHTDAPEAP